MDKTIVIRGTVDWCKLLGEARPYTGNPKYDKGPYWSIDITPDAKSRKIIEDAGISAKLRDPKGEKETRKESFLTLRQLENKADGKKNKPVEVKDASGRPWGDTDIGNGSVCDIMVKVKDYGRGVEKGAYIMKVRVLDLVEYNGNDFAPLSEDDAFFAAAHKGSQGFSDTAPSSTNIDDDDDSIPF